MTRLWLAPEFWQGSERRIALLLWPALLLVLMGAGGDLLLRTASLADVALTQAWTFVPKVLAKSDYGTLWQVRMVAWGGLLLSVLALGRWSRFAAWGLVLGGLVSLFCVSGSSHAGEEGLFVFGNLNHWLHLVSISLWGGAVIVYALVILPELCRKEWSPDTGLVAGRLSLLATVAVIWVVITGLFNCWRQMNGVSDLWQTDYGQWLLLKLICVSLMMLIGALNRFRLVPQIQACDVVDTDRGQQLLSRFTWVLRLDSLLFIVLVLLAVFLGRQEPPAHIM